MHKHDSLQGSLDLLVLGFVVVTQSRIAPAFAFTLNTRKY